MQGSTAGESGQGALDDDEEAIVCLKHLGQKVAALEELKQELEARNRMLENLQLRHASSTSCTGHNSSQVFFRLVL